MPLYAPHVILDAVMTHMEDGLSEQQAIEATKRELADLIENQPGAWSAAMTGLRRQKYTRLIVQGVRLPAPDGTMAAALAPHQHRIRTAAQRLRELVLDNALEVAGEAEPDLSAITQINALEADLLARYAGLDSEVQREVQEHRPRRSRSGPRA